MDPLSITGTAIAITTLVAQITKLTRAYTKSLKGADETVRSFVTEITSLAAVLDALKEDEEQNGQWREMRRKRDAARDVEGTAAGTGPEKSGVTVDTINVDANGIPEVVSTGGAMSMLWKQLQECRKELEEMLKRLQEEGKKSGGWWKKRLKVLMWPLEEKEVEEWLAKVERWKTTVGLALKVEDRDVQRRIATGIENMEQQKLESKAAKLKAKRQEKYDAVVKWLAPTDVEPKENHLATKRLQQPGTGKWFLESKDFQDWAKKEFGLLWICGAAGTGKSVLTSLIIDHLTAESKPSGPTQPVYFYIDFKNSAKTNAANIYGSLCVQLLLSHFSELPKELEDRYEKQKTQSLYEQELLDILQYLLSQSQSTTTIIIDGLDECRDREDLLSAIGGLQKKVKVRVLATSRDLVDIKRKFEGFPMVRIQPELTRHDMTLYVREEVARHARLGDLPEAIREIIIDRIAGGANGMFQWAKFQIQHVGKQKTTKKLMAALESLPPGLYETYERALSDIAARDADDKDLALRVLHWLACSFREMLIKELVEAIAIEDGARELDSDDMIMNQEILVELCGSLVTMDRERGTISLAHASVKEYLTSDRVKESEMREFFIPREVNYKLVRYCLTYMCFDDFGSGEVGNLRERVNRHPFYAYATRYWMQHASGHTDMTDGKFMHHIESFFWSSESLPHFAAWQQAFTSLDPLGPQPVGSTPRFYYACLFGLASSTQLLLSKALDPEGVDGELLIAGGTSGNLDVLRLLIDAGALPNHISTSGETALCAAIKASHLPAASYLLSRGTDITRGSPPPLVCAIKTLSLEAVKLCLNAGAPIFDDGSAGNSSIFMAAFIADGDAGRRIWIELLERGIARTLHLELEGAIGQKVPCGDGLLKVHAAAQRNCVEYARRVLKTEKLGNTKVDRLYINATLQLCIKKNRPEFLEMMMEALGENWGEYTKVLETACVRGTAATVAALLRVRAGRDFGDAIILASALGDVEKLGMLLDNGGDPEKRNQYGWSAILSAKAYGHKPVLDLLKSKGYSTDTTAHPTPTGPTTWRQPEEWVPYYPSAHDVLPDGETTPRAGAEINGTDATLSPDVKARVCTIHTDVPIPLSSSSSLYYFEVTLDSSPNNFHIGLVPFKLVYDPDTTFLSDPPGSMESSLGYSSTGTLRTWGIKDDSFAPKFGAGDTVGCAVDLVKGEAWFTVNGTRVGTIMSGVKGMLWPVITLCVGAKISAKFGVAVGGANAGNLAAGKHRMDSVKEINKAMEWHERLLEDMDQEPL